jgi:signal transduction histidine kinase
VIGKSLVSLPAPWGPILCGFARDPVDDRRLQAPGADRRDGRFYLRKARLRQPFGRSPAGVVILVEDKTEQVSLEAKLEHHERLALIGQLAATIAHEIGNPLAAIASVAQNLQSESDEEELRMRLQLIRDQVENITGIVRSLVAYSRAGTSAAQSPASQFLLWDAVNETLSLVRLDPRGRTHPIYNHCPRELQIWGDRTRLIQVFINLLHNACDASPAASAIEVRASADDDRTLIEFEDRGAGIPPEVRARMFEPFFTTKQAGKGTGLGLSLVYNIVRDHGGSLDVHSRAGHGTVVQLSLPASPRPAGIAPGDAEPWVQEPAP